MYKPTRKTSKGFTLIELLTVVAIIGILATIIIPTVGMAQKRAQRAVDQANLREVGKAAAIYASDNRDSLPDPSSQSRSIAGSNSRYFQWFGQLAKYANFNDPNMIVSKLDGAVAQDALPATILNPNTPNTPTLNSQFSALRAVSINVVGGLKSSDQPTVPVAFTRGLSSAGAWKATGSSEDDVNIGPYKDDGGFVLFLGSNIEKFSKLEAASNRGLVAPGGKTTNDLRQAVPNRPSTVRVYGADTGNGVASPSGVSPVALN